MLNDLKLTLFSAAISASAGIAPTATLGFVAPFIVALWRVLAEAISETLPDAWDHQYRHAFTPSTNRRRT
jgi:hypothetical protein